MSVRSQSYIPCIALLLGGLLLCAPPAKANAQSTTKNTAKKQAILIRGAVRSLGLPGFASNAFPALFGEYSIDSKESIYVWATQEALYFDAKLWKSRGLKSYRLLERDADPEDKELSRLASSTIPVSPQWLIALDRPFPQSSNLGGLSSWSVIISIVKSDTNINSGLQSGNNHDSFTLVFLERFAYFLSGVKSPTDASFPAVLEF